MNKLLVQNVLSIIQQPKHNTQDIRNTTNKREYV